MLSLVITLACSALAGYVAGMLMKMNGVWYFYVILGLIGGPVLMSVLVGAVHGNMLKSMNDDLYIVVKWVKQRWSERNIDPEPETEPEETLQKEPDPGQDPDAEPKAEADKPTGEKEPADGKE